MAKRILFVDDEPMVLMGLQRLLRPFRVEWEMQFAPGGNAALEALQNQAFDAIVTDMKMPDVPGVQILETVRQRYPRTLRFALSGESDRESMLKAVTAAHYYLTKPCDPSALRSALQRAFALQDAIGNTKIKDVLGRIDHLPSAPAVYTRLVDAMKSSTCSISLVGGIVAQDIAIASKLLHLANSPLFGFQSHVSDPAQAVSLLGIDAVKSLVLSLGVFSEFTGDTTPQSDVGYVWEHSVLVSRLTRHISELAGFDRKATEDSFAAGLLHEIGMLVLISYLPAEWAAIQRTAATEAIHRSEAERKILGCTRDEIGAHLLDTWCLPSAIIETVTWRERPSACPVQKPGPLACLHIADWACSKFVESRQEPMELDMEFLYRVGLDKRQEEFAAECESVIRKGTA